MEYKAIAAWGKMLGSFQYFIDAETERARKDGAPEDAIYRDSIDDHWHTVRDIHSDRTARRLASIMEEMA